VNVGSIGGAVFAVASGLLAGCSGDDTVASTTTTQAAAAPSTTEPVTFSTVTNSAPTTTILITTVPGETPADLASVDIRIRDALEGRAHCLRGPDIPLDPNLGMPEIGVESCPRVPEVIGLDEELVYDRLGLWKIRTMYRDIPLDWEDSIDANRISLFVVDGVIVDARWA
jgi:hypothetical protein